MAENESKAPEIDFTKIFEITWKRRKLIISGIIIVTLLGILASFFIPRTYISGGFFRISGIVQRVFIPEYKKINSVFTSPVRFTQFIIGKRLYQGKQLTRILDKIEDREQILSMVWPTYSYSKADVQETSQGSPEVNYVLGLNIYCDGRSAEEARYAARVMGMFIRNCFLYGRMDDFVSSKYTNANTTLRKLENQIIDTNFNLDLYNKKKLEIKSLLDRYPEASKTITREVVNVDNNNYRYLSPISQLIGIESAIADFKSDLNTHARNKEKAEFELEIYSKAKQILEKNQFGEDVYLEILNLADRIFKTKDLTNNIVRAVVNQFYIEMENYRNLCFEEMRFLSGDPLPAKVSKPRKRTIIISVFFISVVFFMLLPFVLEFWKKNRKKILGK